MSAFLGPVHIKMYNRILYQDAMSGALLSVAEERGWAQDLRERADAIAPAASSEPLETIIDHSNIHGWLSAAVSICERRYAMIVCGILDGHPERLGELQGVMTRLGQQCGLPGQMGAEQAFQIICDLLLDGMPCDFPFSVTESGTDEVAWQVKNCPHAPHWDAEGCDHETYYKLRDAWAEGALAGSGIIHTRYGGNHSLKRER